MASVDFDPDNEGGFGGSYGRGGTGAGMRRETLVREINHAD